MNQNLKRGLVLILLALLIFGADSKTFTSLVSFPPIKLMGGSVVIETVFRWPGVGKLVMDSINARDYPVIMGFVLIMGTIYMGVNLLADVIAGILDPRILNAQK